MSLWRTKSLSFLEKEASGGANKLERTLGPSSLIMLGVGAIIGAGIFSITGIAASLYAGPAVILSFLIAALSCSLAGLCFSELAAMIPISGGAYSYSYATLGELAAWIIGWVLILEYAAGAAVVSISWSAYLVSFFEGVGIHLPYALVSSPWQPIQLPDGTLHYGIINLPPLLIICMLTGLLIFGTSKSALVNNILVFVKVAVLLIFIAIGFNYIDPANYHPFIPENLGNFGEYGWSGVLRASGVVFLAYIGFDAISTTAQEVKNPQRALPIGMIGSLAVCAVLYVLFALVMVGLVPYGSLNVAAPVAVAINQTPFSWLNNLIKLGIIAGMTSVVLVLLLGQSRIFLTMARDGLLPSFFAKIHHRYHTPWVTNIILMLVIGIFAAFAPLDLVGELTSMGTLFIFAVVCVSVVVLRKTHPDLPRPFKTPWVPVVPILGALICVGMMLFLGFDILFKMLIWIGIGLLIYFAYGKNNSHLAKCESKE